MTTILRSPQTILLVVIPEVEYASKIAMGTPDILIDVVA